MVRLLSSLTTHSGLDITLEDELDVGLFGDVFGA
jgi:hypothetical protein